MAKKKIEQEVVGHENDMPEPSEVVWEDADAAYEDAIAEMERLDLLMEKEA